ncbi:MULTISPECIES: iron-containing redox enzyme family protein [unclassified Nocardia]|uniref:iron-containing redox enzyme family protein n=1 Tax=unclassified Nocardia TaxID=2637762 RepID=UPI001CE462DD|nr:MULTISPECIES: iron-containing redox enzyme family protein [unclassified Nocardia]
MTISTDMTAPALPAPRGELSAALIERLRDSPGRPLCRVGDTDPYGEDLHSALHTCYELHYHGFSTVDPDWEWDPELLRFRAALETRFGAALRADVAGGDDLATELDRMLTEPAEPGGLSEYLRAEGELWQLREYFVHRSIYHHKEADPYIWVVPRLTGQPKAALVAVEFDEFGGGRGDRVHARLFADLLAGAGLHDGYLHYLDTVPAPMLAVVNMMSLFGLHRGLRGALIGHFATVEITSPPGARRMVAALERLHPDPACLRFYLEHVTADAVHEQVMRHEVIGNLIAQQPDSITDLVFGMQATNLLEDRFADRVLDSWRAGRSSLHEPVRGAV